jgi:hypothetical protein
MFFFLLSIDFFGVHGYAWKIVSTGMGAPPPVPLEVAQEAAPDVTSSRQALSRIRLVEGLDALLALSTSRLF